jgi:hypothetical protein
MLPKDERGTPGCAALLRIEVREHRAFARDAIDVGRLVAHHSVIISADVVNPDVVASDNENVGLLRLLLRGCWIR